MQRTLEKKATLSTDLYPSKKANIETSVQSYKPISLNPKENQLVDGMRISRHRQQHNEIMEGTWIFKMLLVPIIAAGSDIRR